MINWLFWRFVSTTEIETEEDYADSSKSPGAAHAGDGSRTFQTTENYPTQTKPTGNDTHSDFPKDIECYEKNSNIAREAGGL